MKRAKPVPMSSFFPPRSPRARGGPKKAISFRATEPLTSYVESVVKRGYSLTEVMMQLGLIAKDVISGVESVRLLVEHEADKRGLSVGAVVAELCAERLKELYPGFLERPSKR